MGSSDLSTENIQTIYGIWDYSDDPGEYLGEFNSITKRVSNHPDSIHLVEQTIVSSRSTGDGATYRTLSSRPVTYTTVLDGSDPNPNQAVKEGLPNPSQDVGWYLNLTPSERVHQNVRIWNNVLIALGRTPTLAPCQGGGFSMVYFLSPSTGCMIQEAESDGGLKAPPVIVSTPSGDRMIFGGGSGRTVDELPDGGISTGVYFWRQFF